MAAMNRLAHRAKAHWGYATQDLERWAQALDVHPDTIGAWPTFVAEDAGRMLGWAQIDPTRTPWALDALWVAPEWLRQGVGAGLLAKVCAVAAASGQVVLAVDADPHAEGFYLKFGARRTGRVPAPTATEPDRCRRQLELLTASASLAQASASAVHPRRALVPDPANGNPAADA